MSAAAEMVSGVSRVLAEYFSLTDRIAIGSGADVFAADGRMRVGKLVRDGRDEIGDYFAERRAQEDSGGRKTRHVMSNLAVDAVGEDAATVRFLCLVFAGVGELPLPSAPPATIADFTADCVRAGDKWLIQELRAQLVFTGANAATFAR